MGYILTILTACVTILNAELPPLGIHRKLVLPDLGTVHSYFPHSNNAQVKVTSRQISHQPQPFSAGTDAGTSHSNIPVSGSFNKHSIFNGFSGGGSSTPLPHSFNIKGNVRLHPTTNPSSIEGDVHFTGYRNENFNYNQQSHDFEDTRTVTDHNQLPLVHNNTPLPNYPSGNEVSVESKHQVPPFVSSVDTPYETTNQHPIDYIETPEFESRDKLEDNLNLEWTNFKIKFNKAYSTSDEENYRKEVFYENRAKIQRFNMEYSEGKRNFVHRINPYADLLLHEFTNRFCGFNRSSIAPEKETKPATAFVPSANVAFPESVDWREVGAVGPVRTQGKCAACWAFAAAGALEGHHHRKTGNLVDISVQNLIDCTKPYGNNGCSGGLMDPAFEYVRDNNGVDSEPSYPFEEKDGQCRFKPEDIVATCTGFVDIGQNDEEGLKIALATLGPVTAAIDAGKDTFQFYSDGVYDDPECGNKPEQMNHAVLIVGYGTEPDGKKYWLVKNSYGPQWGMGGYIKIARDNKNQCGIAIKASYPLV